MKQTRFLFLLLSLCMCVLGCSNAPTQQAPADPPQQQAGHNEVMPADIVAALSAKEAREENPAHNDILAAVELPRSLGIAILNIDTTRVHDTHPLLHAQAERLTGHGFSNEEIAGMDFGDYKKIEDTWLLSTGAIENIKTIYPGLADTDLSAWSYGDFRAYSMEADARTYAPTAEQAAAFAARNITLDDARKLLQEFHSYETILQQNDETLKEHVTRYYQFKIDYVKQLALYSKQAKHVPGS